MSLRPGNILVTIRDPRNLNYLKKVLETTDTTRQDVMVMTARIYHREPSFRRSSMDSKELCVVGYTSSQRNPRLAHRNRSLHSD